MIDFSVLKKQYKSELLNNVAPFWLSQSQDTEFGGYFTCLDRQGSVFDTDKFIWLQGRQVWLFAMLYNKVEKRQEWLECAIQGAEFLKKHGHDGNYNWYFSLTREGRRIRNDCIFDPHRSLFLERRSIGLNQHLLVGLLSGIHILHGGIYQCCYFRVPFRNVPH